MHYITFNKSLWAIEVSLRFYTLVLSINFTLEWFTSVFLHLSGGETQPNILDTHSLVLGHKILIVQLHSFLF